MLLYDLKLTNIYAFRRVIPSGLPVISYNSNKKEAVS